MFPIYYSGDACGNACLEKQGLYYLVICECKIPTSKPCKIKIITDENSYDLGTCIKVGNRYTVDTRIPIKYLQGKKLKFIMYTNTPCSEFIPVEECKPFPHLQNLYKARMAHRNGIIGIILTE